MRGHHAPSDASGRNLRSSTNGSARRTRRRPRQPEPSGEHERKRWDWQGRRAPLPPLTQRHASWFDTAATSSGESAHTAHSWAGWTKRTRRPAVSGASRPRRSKRCRRPRRAAPPRPARRAGGAARGMQHQQARSPVCRGRHPQGALVGRVTARAAEPAGPPARPADAAPRGRRRPLRRDPCWATPCPCRWRPRAAGRCRRVDADRHRRRTRPVPLTAPGEAATDRGRTAG